MIGVDSGRAVAFAMDDILLFGLMAGITYWFPKAFGYKLDPFWGKMSFWFWLTGFYFAFMPLYVLGLMGVTRRVSQFEGAS